LHGINQQLFAATRHVKAQCPSFGIAGAVSAEEDL